MDITLIILGILTLLGGLITRYIIPWLKAKTGSTNWDRICKWAVTFVEGIEEIITGTKMGEQKRDKVMQMLREECEKYNIRYNELEIRSALESAWANMKKKKENSIPTVIHKIDE